MATTTPALRHVKLYAVSSNADSGGASDFSQSVAPGLLQCKQSENLRVRLLSFDTRYTFPVIQAGYNSGFVLRSPNVPTIVAGSNDTYTIYTQAGGTQRQIGVQMPAGQVTDQEIISSFAATYGASLGITLTVSYAGTGAWTFSSPSPFSINWTLVQPNVQARFGFASAAYVAQQQGSSGPCTISTNQDANPYAAMYTIYNIPYGSPNLDSVITSLNNQLPGFNVTDSDGSVAPTDALIFSAYSNTRQDLYLDFSAPRLQVSCAKALGFIRGNSYALGTSLTSPGAACIVGPDTLVLSFTGTNSGLPGSAVSNFQPGSTTFQSTPSVLAAIPVNVAYNQRISYSGHSEDPGLQLVDRVVSTLSLSIRDPLGFSLNLSSMIYSICLLFTFES